MDIQSWTFVMVGVSFALYIAIAIWSRAASTSEFYVAGKLDRVHLERTDEVDEALHDCLSGKLEALSFPKLETHAKTRVQVHVALESPAPPEDVTKD